MNSVDFFNTHKFSVIKDLISKETAYVLYRYVLLNSKKSLYLKNNHPDIYNKSVHGRFDDDQALGDFSLYGDCVFDNLLEIVTPKIEEITGMSLVPTYTYHRLYTKGTELKKHIDRPSCEISASLTLGFDSDDKDYVWPFWLKKPFEENKYCIKLYEGDAIVYSGCYLEHWRDKLNCKNQAQVFLHFNKKTDKDENIYDTRPMLGLPVTFCKK